MKYANCNETDYQNVNIFNSAISFLLINVYCKLDLFCSNEINKDTTDKLIKKRLSKSNYTNTRYRHDTTPINSKFFV